MDSVKKTIFTFDVFEMIDDHNMICFSFYVNLVFSVSIDSGEITVIGSIPEEPFIKQQLIADIVYWKGNIIFVPMTASKLWIYSINQKEWEGIPFENTDVEDKDFKFSGSVLEKNTLFLLGYEYFGIARVELENHFRIEYLAAKKWNQNHKTFCWGKNTKREGRELWFPSCENVLVKLSMDTMEYDYLKLGDKRERYVGICDFGTDTIIAPLTNKDPVIVMNQWKENRRIELPKDIANADLIAFEGCYLYGDKVIIYGINGYSLVVEKKQDEYNIHMIRKSMFCSNATCDGDRIISGEGRVAFYSDATKQWRTVNLLIEDFHVFDCYPFLTDCMLEETKQNDLRFYLSAISGVYVE